MTDWREKFEAQRAIELRMPEYLLQAGRRAPVRVAPPVARVYDERPLPEVRKSLQEAMKNYMRIPDPQHILLLKPPPGTGKTYAGVAFAHWAYLTTNRRVLYAGPRHAFYTDVTNEVEKQGANMALWYEWLPRQDTLDKDPRRHTCRHADDIAAWQGRGYQSMSFCSQICGWNYVKEECGYHAQKKRMEPIIFGQHAHVVLGHPLAQEFGVLIGDEDPSNAFTRLWTIPTKFIVPPDMGPTERLYPLLRKLQKLSEEGLALHGDPLYELLGAEYVAKLLEGVLVTPKDIVIDPHINTPGDVQEVGYAFLPLALNLLSREALGAAAKEAFPPRVFLNKQGLTLELRNYVNEHMPRHIVWFDGTGSPDLYATMFGRDVDTVEVQLPLTGRIFQVIDRANGKSALLQNDTKTGADAPTAQAQDALKLVQFVVNQYEYKQPAVITFMQLESLFRRAGFTRVAHFYGQRGTNSFVDCDAVFVVGTPMPALTQIERLARMLWFREMRQFDRTWVTTERDFNYIARTGEGVAYPVSQFQDDRLNAVLYAARENEMEQAAHRGRPIFRQSDVWLLSNVPLPNLPPTKLLTSRTIYNIPEGVNVNKWLAFLATMERLGNESPNGVVTANQLEGLPGMPEKKTLLQYFAELENRFADRWGKPPPSLMLLKGRGRPPKALQMTFSPEGITVETDKLDEYIEYSPETTLADKEATPTDIV